jgi:hypothetical protein
MLDRANAIPEDERFDPRAREAARSGRSSLRTYLTGGTRFAEVTEASRSVVVMPDRRFILVQHGWQPVYAHLWMDRPGTSGSSAAEYRRLSPEERACVSARTVLLESFEGYARLWLQCYWPDVAARLWWDDGLAALEWEDPDAARTRFEASAAELRSSER